MRSWFGPDTCGGAFGADDGACSTDVGGASCGGHKLLVVVLLLLVAVLMLLLVMLMVLVNLQMLHQVELAVLLWS